MYLIKDNLANSASREIVVSKKKFNQNFSHLSVYLKIANKYPHSAKGSDLDPQK